MLTKSRVKSRPSVLWCYRDKLEISSTSYTRRHNTQILLNRDSSGRLMKYDARAKRVIVLMDALPYSNGVAVSADRTHVVVAHTGPCQLFRQHQACSVRR
jgi:sugar lactone lactonase YvrE